MNNKRKLTKSISVALLVALASLATTGLVLADHAIPVEGVPVSSGIYYDLYQTALDHMEEDRNLAVETSLDKTNTSSRDTFSLGSIAALKQLERGQETASLLNTTDIGRLNALIQGYNARIQLNKANIRRQGALIQGYNARIQMEENRNAAFEKSRVPNSGDSWFLAEHSSFGR